MPLPLQFSDHLVVEAFPIVAADVDKHVMPIATPPTGRYGYALILEAVSFVLTAAGGAAATVMVRRCRAQAPASGTACLSATLDLTLSVDVVRAGSMVVKDDDRTFLPGDTLAFDFSGTLTALNGVVTCTFRRITG